MNYFLEKIVYKFKSFMEKIQIYKVKNGYINEQKLIQLVYQKPFLLYYIKPVDNAKVINAALRKDKYALQFAAMKIRNDKDFMLKHKNLGFGCMMYLGPALRDNKSVVMATVAEQLKKEKKDYIGSFSEFCDALKNLGPKLSDDKELFLTVANSKKNTGCLPFVSPTLKKDREFILKLLEVNGIDLKNVSEELAGDKEIVLAAVGSYGKALKYASEDLRGDDDVILRAISSSESIADRLKILKFAIISREKFLYLSNLITDNKLEDESLSIMPRFDDRQDIANSNTYGFDNMYLSSSGRSR
ncbi:MAG: DUF4116 domain-containing protein [Bacilli bacterium]|nr:DUF4116 domain-containing protein [Bacilli bacterium]